MESETRREVLLTEEKRVHFEARPENSLISAIKAPFCSRLEQKF